jgi:4-alpha-glucanotransferase
MPPKKMSVSIDPWGIASGYQDAFGHYREVSRQTRSHIRQSMGRPNRPDNPDLKIVTKILPQPQRLAVDEPSELALEDGSSLQVDHLTPADIPIGYHRLRSLRGSQITHVMVTPGTCYLPEDLRWRGMALQLYALRSEKSWGIGDLRDLKELSGWLKQSLGYDFVLLNPLAAAVPITPQQASPYYPSSRRFLNPLYLRIEDIPHYRTSLGPLAATGRQLNQNRLIDRDAVFRLKMQALKKLWDQFRGDPAFDQFCSSQGRPLADYSTFCALAEHFHAGWTRWPKAFHKPTSTGVQHFARDHQDRLRFHQWLQWQLHRQLKRAAHELPLIQDLPVGVDPAGADAWIWQDLLAQAVSIGAPPDAYNHQGQNWGLQPFVPQRLRESFYEPFRLTVKAMLAFGGGLRIDHVMGLFRLFWVPQDAPANQGAYVEYPVDDLLAILAIESHRTKAIIVGEDLGTVAPGVREKLRRQNILSYRLLWFESGPPKSFPTQAMAAVTTHDLFSIAGLWTRSDLIRQQKLGLHPNEKDTGKILSLLRRRLHLKSQAPLEQVITGTYQLLAQAPSRLLTVSLDDALAVEERPNLPGTSNTHNWSLALPMPLEKIKTHTLIKEVSQACQRK